MIMLCHKTTDAALETVVEALSVQGCQDGPHSSTEHIVPLTTGRKVKPLENG